MKESLSQLLVHLDGSPRAARRLAVARDIAQTHGAAVTALYAVTPALLVVPFAPEAGPSVAEALGQIDEERRTHARGIFDRSVASPGVHAAWAEVQDYPIVPAFARQALYADLLVLGQHDPTDTEAAGVPFDFAETVMASSGKPALILPYADIPSTAVGQTIVIAWKPTREAARAVSAAVPLLQRARRVHVLSWGKEEEDVAGARLDLDGYLKLRGVEPTWHREGEEPDFMGDLLLSRAFDLDADLMVMGCYGHSRAREWVLGGTSRTVLQSMTLPVLMAH